MKRPHVLLSVAASIDGYIDDSSPSRLMLSNDADFDRVDQVRAEADAIMIGAGTMRTDNPRLIVKSGPRRKARVASGQPEHPLKIAVTATGNLDRSLNWFHHGGDRIVYTTDATSPGLERRLDGLAEVVSTGPRLDFGAILDNLGQRGVARLLVEGGETVHTSILSQGLADEIHLALAPLLVGSGPRFLAATTYPWPTSRRMQLESVEKIGDIALIRYRPRSESMEDVMRTDEEWLLEAVDLARQCPPSPGAFSVGAIIVSSNGTELARGYSRDTDPVVHAEESALAKVDDRASLAGATIYSTLEPCGERRSRPQTCAQLIIDSGIARVVYAWREPNDFVDHPDGHSAIVAAGLDATELPDIGTPNYRPAEPPSPPRSPHGDRPT